MVRNTENSGKSRPIYIHFYNYVLDIVLPFFLVFYKVNNRYVPAETLNHHATSQACAID